jgi:hypothetical protein
MGGLITLCEKPYAYFLEQTKCCVLFLCFVFSMRFLMLCRYYIICFFLLADHWHLAWESISMYSSSIQAIMAAGAGHHGLLEHQPPFVDILCLWGKTFPNRHVSCNCADTSLILSSVSENVKCIHIQDYMLGRRATLNNPTSCAMESISFV